MRKNTYILIFFLAALVTFTSCLSRPERIRSNYPNSSKSSHTSKNTIEKYADIIGVSSSELSSLELYDYIDDWMGTPHRLGGLNKNGIDCSAFTNHLVRDVYGKDLPRTANDMAQVIKRKYENQLREGDLVFFNFSGKKFDHVGVYLKNNKFVHVSTSKGVIISDLTDPWYRNYFTRAGSIL